MVDAYDERVLKLEKEFTYTYENMNDQVFERSMRVRGLPVIGFKGHWERDSTGGGSDISCCCSCVFS